MHIDNDIRHLKEMLYIHHALSEALLSVAVKVLGAVNEKINNLSRYVTSYLHSKTS